MLLYLLFLIIDIWSPHPIKFTKHIVHTESVHWMGGWQRKEEGRRYTWQREAMPHATGVLPVEFGSRFCHKLTERSGPSDSIITPALHTRTSWHRAPVSVFSSLTLFSFLPLLNCMVSGLDQIIFRSPQHWWWKGSAVLYLRDSRWSETQNV